MAPEAITALLASLLPQGVCFSAGVIADIEPSPYDIEAECVARAVASRQREFFCGRLRARQALVRLGLTPSAIPRQPDRSPAWPGGVVGSITHSNRYCAAIVALRARFMGIGIDMEPAEALEPSVAEAILTPGEQGLPVSGKIIFSVKEAFFKAYFPSTRVFLDFKDAEVSLAGEPGHLAIHLTNPDKPPLAGMRSFRGRFGTVDHEVVTSVCIGR